MEKKEKSKDNKKKHMDEIVKNSRKDYNQNKKKIIVCHGLKIP